MSSNKKTQVMLLGTFHFANPGLDLVKTRVHDVMGEASQAYLKELALRMAKFNPTAVLLEYDIKEDHSINKLYSQYQRGSHELAADEVQQIGFRIAKNSGLSRVESFDERGVPWPSKNLFEALKAEPELEKQFNGAIEILTNNDKMDHSKLSLRELLLKHNHKDRDHLSNSLYILTNRAGVEQNFAGADASASWWHRNFRMLARIQKFARPGERLLVIGGQGHIAVIRDLIKYDSNMIIEDINSYL